MTYTWARTLCTVAPTRVTYGYVIMYTVYSWVFIARKTTTKNTFPVCTCDEKNNATRIKCKYLAGCVTVGVHTSGLPGTYPVTRRYTYRGLLLSRGRPKSKVSTLLVYTVQSTVYATVKCIMLINTLKVKLRGIPYQSTQYITT
jgi:hypothetical protein